MSQGPTRALLEAIAGRAELIECLTEGITDKRDLEARLGKSRSTINRWLNALRQADVITPAAEGHQLTVLGTLAYEEYARFEHRFTGIVNAKPLLVYLPSDVEFGVEVLEDAEVLLSEEIAPLEPILRLEEMVQTAETRVLKAISPVILPRYVEFFHHQVMTNGFEVEFVLERQVMEYLLSAYNEELTAMLETGHGTFSRVEGSALPYGLVVIDQEGIWIGIYEPGGGLRGAIINTSQAAIEWAHDQYNNVRGRAEAVEQGDLMLRGATNRSL